MDYKKYNDNELIYMVQENDEDSVNLLVRKYSPIIYRLSNEYYKKYNDSGYEFDDFCQEALSAFYKSLHTFDSTKDVLFYTFVNVCIRRTLSSFGRTAYSNKIKEYNNIDIAELEYCVEDIRENPIYKDSFRGLENIVRDVIFGSSLEVGAILELKINGFTYKEIGILLDIPKSSVEFKSRRARNLLRNKVRLYYCK